MSEFHRLPPPGTDPANPLVGTWRFQSAVCDVTLLSNGAVYIAALEASQPRGGDGSGLLARIGRAADALDVPLCLLSGPQTLSWYAEQGYRPTASHAGITMLVRPAGGSGRPGGPGFMHADRSCPVCFPQGQPVTAAVPAPPMRNPEVGGLNWYHGTHFDPSDEPESHQEEAESRGHGHDPDPAGYLTHPEGREPEEESDSHWNTGLGVHFTGLHGVAESFANGSGGKWGTTPRHDSRVAHAHLHMANPKHYADETEMARHAIQIAHGDDLSRGHRYFTDHDHRPGGPADRFAKGEAPHDDDWDNHSDDLERAQRNLSPAGRKAVVDIDKHGVQPHHTLHEMDSYLSQHPHREHVLWKYQQHLKEQGHDGITYGNEYEGPQGHRCAIAMDPRQIHVKKWNWLHPDHPSHQEHNTDDWASGDQKTIGDFQHPDGRPKTATTNYNSGGIGHVGEDRTVVGLVPIHKILPFKEHSGDQHYRSEEIVKGIADSIKTPDDLREPLMMEYDHKRKLGSLGEGNHRLEAAQRAGLTHVPVRVHGRSNLSYRQEKGLTHPLHLSTDFGNDYVPPDIHPHHFEALRDDTKTAGRPRPLQRPEHPFTPHPDDPTQCVECNLPKDNRHHQDVDYQTRLPGTLSHVLTDWQPSERLFSPTKETLDPRLFSGKQMLPEVRSVLMQKMTDFMGRHGGPGWTDWARMYLAGSEASLWWASYDAPHASEGESSAASASSPGSGLGGQHGVRHLAGQAGHPGVPEDGVRGSEGGRVPGGLGAGSLDAGARGAGTRPRGRERVYVEGVHQLAASRTCDASTEHAAREHRGSQERREDALSAGSPPVRSEPVRHSAGRADVPDVQDRRWTPRTPEARWHLNDDIDILVGIDYDAFRKATGSSLRDEEITDAFNRDFRLHWNDDEIYFVVPIEGVPEWTWASDPIEGFVKVGPWGMTGYVNPGSWDIRKIRPYAAYEIVSEVWYVEPPEEPTGHRFADSDWYYFEGVAERVRAAAELREPSRSNALNRIWQFIHSERSKAFSPEGHGAFDHRNAIEKYLVQAGLWDVLVQSRFGKTAGSVAPFPPFWTLAGPIKGEECQCCGGSGEHPSGHECYRCDASGYEKGATGTCDAETMSKGAAIKLRCGDCGEDYFTDGEKHGCIDKTAAVGTYSLKHTVRSWKYGDKAFGDEIEEQSPEDLEHAETHNVPTPHFEHSVHRNGVKVGQLVYSIGNGANRDRMEVKGLSIHPAHRGAGLGSHLMDQMQRHAHQTGQTIDHGIRTTMGHRWWQSYSKSPSFMPHVHEPDRLDAAPGPDATDSHADQWGNWQFDKDEFEKGHTAAIHQGIDTSGWDHYYANEVEHADANPLLGHLLDGTFSQSFSGPGWDHDEPREDVLRRHNMLPAEHLRLEAALHDLSYPKRPDTYWASDEDKARMGAEHDQRLSEFHNNVAREMGKHPDTVPRYDAKTQWEHGIRHALSTGKISLDDAKSRGYYGDAREMGSTEGTGWDDNGKSHVRGGWKQLPHGLFHVTTNLHGVYSAGGLKTRSELGQSLGHGLGGGSDHTISVTTDHGLAHDIYHSLHEYHAFLNGKISTEDLSKVHHGGADPEAMAKSLHSTIGHDRLDQIKRGMTSVSKPGAYGRGDIPGDDSKKSPDAFMTQSEVHEKHGSDWQVKPGHEPISGEGDSGRYASHSWERPATDEEKVQHRSDIYKALTHHRGWNGGHRDPLFMSNDPVAFAKSDPNEFGLLHLHGKGQGYPLRGEGEHEGGADSGEWRTHSGEALGMTGHFEAPHPRWEQEQDAHDEKQHFERTAASVYGSQEEPEQHSYFRGLNMSGKGSEDVDWDSDESVLNHLKARTTRYTSKDLRGHPRGNRFGTHWSSDHETARRFALNIADNMGRRTQLNTNEPRYAAVLEAKTSVPHEHDTFNAHYGESETRRPTHDEMNSVTLHLHRLDPDDHKPTRMRETYVRSIEMPESHFKPSADETTAHLRDSVKFHKEFGPPEMHEQAKADLKAHLLQQKTAALDPDDLMGLTNSREYIGADPVEVKPTIDNDGTTHLIKHLKDHHGYSDTSALWGRASHEVSALHDEAHQTGADHLHDRRHFDPHRDGTMHSLSAQRRYTHDEISDAMHPDGYYENGTVLDRLSEDATATLEHIPTQHLTHLVNTATEPGLHVKHLGEAMRDGADLPPVVLHRQQGQYALEDGYHRILAAHHYKVPHVKAFVFDRDRDGTMHSLSAEKAGSLWHTSPVKNRQSIEQHGLIPHHEDAADDPDISPELWVHTKRPDEVSGDLWRIDGHDHAATHGSEASSEWHADSPVAVLYDHPIPPHHLTREARIHHPEQGPDGEPADGIMIALVPPKRVIKNLPLPEDGEHPSNVHITLVYLGKVTEFTKAQVEYLPELVESWAETQKPLKATVQGVGTFSNPGSHVLWAAADIPGGNHLWVSLADTLRSHGYAFKENHGWTPHLTMSYEKHHVRFLPKVERMEFDVREVFCCIGGRWESFPLTGGRSARKDSGS